ncbi:ferrochelatase [Lacibacterium aquatile]|uniref:Ferrochelatase n=1 Tax=Lacibacterium aquatile TaxID=1168082 RepID=A0ABW5E1V1_9PROT
MPSPKIGALLVNLGTPDAPTVGPVRRYLREFLSDRRVVEANPVLWQLLLNTIILTFRPARTAKNYAKVWGEDSPLRLFTKRQAEALAPEFQDTVIVDWAMRYGNPSLKSKIEALSAQGCDRILVVPLYPQYSASTNASVADQAFRVLMKMRRQPAVRIAPDWHDDPAYIEALASSITQHLTTLDWQPEVILASFHGIPKEYGEKGDPYPQLCAKTAELLRARLGMDENRLKLTFQSRFGPKEWTQPYTDVTLVEMAKAGIKKVAVITPGFVADCIETLEEIDIGDREAFIHAGGSHFTTVPCLNDSAGGLTVLRGILERELAGWR